MIAEIKANVPRGAPTPTPALALVLRTSDGVSVGVVDVEDAVIVIRDVEAAGVSVVDVDGVGIVDDIGNDEDNVALELDALRVICVEDDCVAP